jgi:3-phosphoshikimate 1-carboxyvinyltransferase
MSTSPWPRSKPSDWRQDERAQLHRAGQSAFKVSRALAVEGDWSNAAFWLSHGAVGDGSITVAGLDPSSPQGDKAIMTFLERFGARVSVDGGTVTVSRGDLYGMDIDAGDTPDLGPVLAAVAAVSRGRTVISNAGRLRLKESDRLKAITETLSALGADITQTDDGFIIDGRPRLRGGVVSSHGDHRIAMTAAVVSTACLEAVTIKGAEAGGKSYPGFFTDLAALGGAVAEG